MFTPKRVTSASEEVGEVIDLLGIKPGADILDLGCGIGRHSLALARRGFQVTGVDRTVSYLEEAGKTADEEGLSVELLEDDMRSFTRAGAFDTALSMYTSFSYFEDPEDDSQVVRNVYESLKPGGTFLIETHGKETLAKIFMERNWSEEEDGTIVLQQRTVTRNWSWMVNRWIIFNGNERTEHRFSHRLYAGTEMAALMTGCGFSRAEIYGDLDGSPYDQNARQLIAVGYK